MDLKLDENVTYLNRDNFKIVQKDNGEVFLINLNDENNIIQPTMMVPGH